MLCYTNPLVIRNNVEFYNFVLCAEICDFPTFQDFFKVFEGWSARGGLLHPIVAFERDAIDNEVESAQGVYFKRGQ